MVHIRFNNDDDEAMDAEPTPSAAARLPPPPPPPVASSSPAPTPRPATTTGPMPPLAHVLSRARVDFAFDDPAYVTRVAANPTAQGLTIAAAVAGGGGRRGSGATGVRLLQSSNGSSSLAAAGSLATSAVVPALTFIQGAPHLLATCAHDGTVCVWDLRQPLLSSSSAGGGPQAAAAPAPRPAEAYSAPQRGTELHCLSVFAAGGSAPGGGGATIAAGGTGGDVYFWDRRGGRGAGGGGGGGGAGGNNSSSFARPFVTFDDLHMDDVTALVAHEPSGCLLSASQDGLVAVVDIRGSKARAGGGAGGGGGGGGAGAGGASLLAPLSDAVSPFDPDDGFAAALNAATSVEDIGLYGPELESAWVRTGTETVQLWEWREALKGGGGEGEEDEEAALRGAAAAEVARPALAAAALARFPTLLPPVAPEDAEVGACGVDYLIGCQYDPATDQLLLAAGSNDGTAALWPVARRRAGAAAGAPPAVDVGAPVLALRGGHPGAVVRAAQVLPAASLRSGAFPLVVTGGEDAQVCVWQVGGGGAGGGGAGGSGARGDRSGSAGPASSGPERRGGGGGGGGTGGGGGSGSAEGGRGPVRRTPY